MASITLSVDERLAQCKALAYDCEILSCIHMQGEVREEGYHYCNGWDDFDGMGIACVAAYDFVTGAYRLYLGDNFNEFNELVKERKIFISYNGKKFDNPLLRTYGIDLPESRCYDLWLEIINTLPLGDRKGYSLNNMLAANDLGAKSGSGGDAPKLAQRGRWGSLLNYNLDDTRLMVKLLRLACSGAMKSPKTGEYMIIKKPWDIVSVDTNALF